VALSRADRLISFLFDITCPSFVCAVKEQRFLRPHLERFFLFSNAPLVVVVIFLSFGPPQFFLIAEKALPYFVVLFRRRRSLALPSIKFLPSFSELFCARPLRDDESSLYSLSGDPPLFSFSLLDWIGPGTRLLSFFPRDFFKRLFWSVFLFDVFFFLFFFFGGGCGGFFLFFFFCFFFFFGVFVCGGLCVSSGGDCTFRPPLSFLL